MMEKQKNSRQNNYHIRKIDGEKNYYIIRKNRLVGKTVKKEKNAVIHEFYSSPPLIHFLGA